ncbi:MAG: hypothetical protein V4641_18625 [Pseudomonadota bacterium]
MIIKFRCKSTLIRMNWPNSTIFMIAAVSALLSAMLLMMKKQAA